MVMILPYLSESSAGDDQFWSQAHLSQEDKNKVAELSHALTDLLSPLTQITTNEALQDLLQARKPRFLQVKSELIKILWSYLVDQAQGNGGYDQMRQIAIDKSDLIGVKALQQLLSTLDSSEAFRNWAIETGKQGGPEADRVSTVFEQVGGFTPYGDMCISALMGVLTDRITAWEPAAVPLLAEAADDYMTSVEDVFLGEPSVPEDVRETVDYESIRTQIGL